VKVTPSLAMLAASLFLIAACSDAGTGVGDGPMPVGRFELVSVNGAPLPFALRRFVGASSTTPGTTSSCTSYLVAMSIDVSSSGSVNKSESERSTCDDGGPVLASVFLEPGTVSRTPEGWRFDFGSTYLASTELLSVTHYFGRFDGTDLTIYRRETDAIPSQFGGVSVGATVNLTPLVFHRV
jgi:hypothetical protein